MQRKRVSSQQAALLFKCTELMCTGNYMVHRTEWCRLPLPLIDSSNSLKVCCLMATLCSTELLIVRSSVGFSISSDSVELSLIFKVPATVIRSISLPCFIKDMFFVPFPHIHFPFSKLRLQKRQQEDIVVASLLVSFRSTDFLNNAHCDEMLGLSQLLP